LLAAMIARYPGEDLRHPAARAEAAGRMRLESLATPTLVLSGAHDLASRKRAARELTARLSHAELAEIPGAGHMPNLDRPDAYSNLCREFLAQHCPRATC